jgi:hypothetical protein
MLYKRGIKDLFPGGDAAGTDFLDIIRVLMALKELAEALKDQKPELTASVVGVVDSVMDEVLKISRSMELRSLKSTVTKTGFFDKTWETDEDFWRSNRRDWTADAEPLRRLFDFVAEPFAMEAGDSVQDNGLLFNTDGSLAGVQLNSFDVAFVDLDPETDTPVPK